MLRLSVHSVKFSCSILLFITILSLTSLFSKYLNFSPKCRHTYYAFQNICTTCLNVVFAIRNVVIHMAGSNTCTLRVLNIVFTIHNVVIHMAYSNTCTLPFPNIVFTIRNVVIHMAYSKIAYLCSVSSLLYLLPISRCDWSSLPAVSSSGQSVTCSHVQHFGHNI